LCIRNKNQKIKIMISLKRRKQSKHRILHHHHRPKTKTTVEKEKEQNKSESEFEQSNNEVPQATEIPQVRTTRRGLSIKRKRIKIKKQKSKSFVLFRNKPKQLIRVRRRQRQQKQQQQQQKCFDFGGHTQRDLVANNVVVLDSLCGVANSNQRNVGIPSIHAINAVNSSRAAGTTERPIDDLGFIFMKITNHNTLNFRSLFGSTGIQIETVGNELYFTNINPITIIENNDAGEVPLCTQTTSDLTTTSFFKPLASSDTLIVNDNGSFIDFQVIGGGTTGAQGRQGPHGFQGFQGSDGFFGTQGFQGLQAPPGANGVQGFQGSDGFFGTQGFQGQSNGAQGFQGLQAPPGLQGFQGFLGTQGFQGHANGAQGFQGFQAPPGSDGLQGYQGYQGIQGPQGFRGFQGPQISLSGLGTSFFSTTFRQNNSTAFINTSNGQLNAVACVIPSTPGASFVSKCAIVAAATTTGKTGTFTVADASPPVTTYGTTTVSLPQDTATYFSFSITTPMPTSGVVYFLYGGTGITNLYGITLY
jgi:hypothetical protein